MDNTRRLFVRAGGVALAAGMAVGAWGAQGKSAIHGGAKAVIFPPATVVADSSYSIVVEQGPFHSLEEASRAEDQVDWSRGDVRKQNAVTEAFAAQELRAYLCRLTGMRLPDRGSFPLVAGDRRRPPQNFLYLASMSSGRLAPAVKSVIAREKLAQRLTRKESFALVPSGRNLFLIGFDRVGTLYAAYHFLEMQGVRWYAPGELGEFVPVGKPIRLPRSTMIQAPAFFTRGFFIYENRGNPEFFLWMARNRLNFWCDATSGHAFLKKLVRHR